MKKHFILTSLFAFTVIVNAQTQKLVSTDRQTPGIRFEKIHGLADQRSGSFSSRGYDYERDDHDDCGKCRNWKKSKKHCACGKPGKHYGKHKHRGKHADSCHNSCCENRKNRGCDDQDRWNDRDCRDRRDDRWGNDNRRDRRDDRWSNDNRRDRRDDNNRRFTSTRRDRDSQYGGNSRSSQRKVVVNDQGKTSRPGTARRPGSRPSGSRH